MHRVWTFGGPLLVVNALIHTVVGVGLYSGALADISRDGFVGEVHPEAEREAAWWFFVVGLLYLTLGVLATWAQRQTGTLPAFLGLTIIGLAIAGMVLAPSRGWPFMAAAGALMLGASRQHHRLPHTAPEGR